jgi:hypothetical protein
MVYMSKYSIYVLRLDLRWLTLSNREKVNYIFVILDEIYNFVDNNFFI